MPITGTSTSDKLALSNNDSAATWAATCGLPAWLVK